MVLDLIKRIKCYSKYRKFSREINNQLNLYKFVQLMRCQIINKNFILNFFNIKVSTYG